jgi:large conductance mechanosensitive channel
MAESKEPKTEKRKAASKVVAQPFNGFVEFLREQAVVGLAIGLVLGTQAKQIVDSLTTNFINPIVGLVTPGGGDLAKKTFVVHHGDKVGTFGWGAFAATLIDFIIVAAVIYFVIKGLRLDKLDKKKA